MKIGRARLKVILKLVVGILIFLALIELFGSLSDIRHLLDFDWHAAWQVVFWTLAINVFAAWRMHLMLKGNVKSGGFFRLLNVILISRAVGHSSSQLVADLGARFLYLKERGVGLRDAGVYIVLDKVFEGVLFLCVLSAFLTIAVIEQAGTAIMDPAFFGLIAVLIYLGLASGFGGWFAKLFVLVPFFRNSSLRMPRQFSAGTCISLGLISLGKYASSTMRFWVILNLTGVNLSYDLAFLGTSMAQLGLLVGLTPGGLGLVEAGWGGALIIYQVPSDLVVKFLVVQRILILASVLLLVPAGFLIGRLGDGKTRREPKTSSTGNLIHDGDKGTEGYHRDVWKHDDS